MGESVLVNQTAVTFVTDCITLALNTRYIYAIIESKIPCASFYILFQI
jgi:hypothetical protein